MPLDMANQKNLISKGITVRDDCISALKMLFFEGRYQHSREISIPKYLKIPQNFDRQLNSKEYRLLLKSSSYTHASF